MELAGSGLAEQLGHRGYSRRNPYYRRNPFDDECFWLSVFFLDHWDPDTSSLFQLTAQSPAPSAGRATASPSARESRKKRSWSTIPFQLLLLLPHSGSYEGSLQPLNRYSHLRVYGRL